MSNDSRLTISKSPIILENGKKGVMVVFMYPGPKDPGPVLDKAVRDYVGNSGYHALIDASLSNPWMRVVISDINEIEQNPFKPEEHSMEKHLSEVNG